MIYSAKHAHATQKRSRDSYDLVATIRLNQFLNNFPELSLKEEKQFLEMLMNSMVCSRQE